MAPHSNQNAEHAAIQNCGMLFALLILEMDLIRGVRMTLKILLLLTVQLFQISLAHAEVVLDTVLDFSQVRSSPVVAPLNAEKGVKLVVVEKNPRSNSDYKVFGYSEKQILAMINDSNGAACSSNHEQGDMANRWCHAAIVKLIDRSWQDQGVHRFLSALMGFSFFAAKEYLIDLHPSKSDLVISDIVLFKDNGVTIEGSLFGDGMFIVVVSHSF